MSAGSLATDLRELLLPRGCLACGERIPPEDEPGLICSGCRSRLRVPPPPCCPRCQLPFGSGHGPGEACLECADWRETLKTARSAVVLDTVAGAMVHALKYRGWGELAEDMARRMAREIPPNLSHPVIVPVPTTPWRRRTRGYNQASLLATAVSSITAVPSLEALRRERGRTQVRLGPRERRSNVDGAFDLRGETRSLIRGRDVIVVDDVLTTGATANAITLALEPAGVASVRLVTFARSLPFSEKG